VQYYHGQPAIGTSSGNAVEGSNASYTLWSFPKGGTSVNNGTSANIQCLRLYWGSSYFRDIFTSPNNGDIYHRAVENGTAKAWRTVIDTGNFTSYITPSAIGAQVAGSYAAASHGNHVPTTETANNARFLRNDNTWQTITPANIGAQVAGSYATSSHTHSSLAQSTGTYGSDCMTYNQISSSFDGRSGWAHYLTFNHGNGETYYHWNLAFPFWSWPVYKRQTGSTSSQTSWYNMFTEENIKIVDSIPSTFGIYFNTGTRA
jgi:hypothetical protein